MVNSGVNEGKGIKKYISFNGEIKFYEILMKKLKIWNSHRRSSF